MGWIQNLCSVYDQNLDAIEAEAKSLLPVGFIEQVAHIEVRIEHSRFISARVLSKTESLTRIPCTIESSSRSGKSPAPHPLFDKLKYIAKDLDQVSDENSSYTNYRKFLEAWCSSDFAYSLVQELFTYLDEGTLAHDLIKEGLLITDDQGKLMKKWNLKENKPLIFQMVTGTQEDAFVRFVVNGVALWKDPELVESFTGFYQKQLQEEGRLDLDLITGEQMPVTMRIPSKVRNSADMSKLISSNDSQGFTYRGRFSNPEESMSMGYESSQKAINALKWLISKQGRTFGEAVFVSWGSKTISLLNYNESADLFDLGGELPDARFDTYEDFSRALNKAMAGYLSKPMVADEEVMTLGLEAATPGRLSIIYYQQTSSSQLFANVLRWHETISWYKTAFKTQGETGKKIPYQTMGSPSINKIVSTLYGEPVNPKLLASSAKRLIKCIQEGQPLPRDFMLKAVTKATNPYGKNTDEYNRVLEVCCAVIRKFYIDEARIKGREENLPVRIDKECQDISYLCGRALAVMHYIEERTKPDGNGKYETNAMRYMGQFVRYPQSTLMNLQAKLQPYLLRLSTNYYENQLTDILSQINPEKFEDAPLTGKFVLGYHAQLHDLKFGYQGKDKRED